MREISVTRLKAVVTYNPETGEFHWLSRSDDGTRHGKTWNSRFAGTLAGNTVPSGYRSLRIDGTSYRSHRLAWLYMTCEMPVNDIDHINGRRDDNRFCNLRDATRQQNLANCHGRHVGKSGHRGAYRIHKGRWRAQISHNFKSYHLGCFDTAEEASAAYKAESARLRGVPHGG